MKKQKGVSLIELMIVMIVLSILVGIAIPQFRKALGRHRTRVARGVAASIRTALEMYKLKYDGYPQQGSITNINDLYNTLSPNVTHDFRENFDELIQYKSYIQSPAKLPTNYTVVLKVRVSPLTYITATPKVLEAVYKGGKIDGPE